MALIVCSGCGNQIEGNEAFCPYCGTSTQAAAAAQGAGTYNPQSGSAAPSYTPPVQTPYPQQPVYGYEFNGKTGKGMGWIVFLRVVLWCLFTVSVAAGLVTGIRVLDYDGLAGFGIIVGSLLVGFILIGGGMIALNNATNLRSIAMNTAKTVELLQSIKRK